MQIETRRLYIRQMTDDDFNRMSLVWLEQWPTLFDLFDGDEEIQAKFLRDMWETTQDPTLLTGLIFLKDSGQFCGRVNIQKTDQEVPEVGIDILKEYQNQGYGPEAVIGLVNWYGESHHVSKVKARVAAGNTHSTHVFEKLGAEYIREDPSSFTSAKKLAEELPEKREAILRDLIVREYILKLPISYP